MNSGAIVPIEVESEEELRIELARRDEAEILRLMTGEMLDEYVYSFKSGGKVVEQLTLAGVNEAANQRGGIKVDLVQATEREDSWLVIVKATDALTGREVLGATEQPKHHANKVPVSSPFTQAVHKAQRNAVRQLLPVPFLKRLIRAYVGENNKQEPTEPESKLTRQEKQAASGKRVQSEHELAAFASWQELKQDLAKQGVDNEMFWEYIRTRFGVANRRDMTETQWAELAAEMRASKSSPEILASLVATVKQQGDNTEETPF